MGSCCSSPSRTDKTEMRRWGRPHRRRSHQGRHRQSHHEPDITAPTGGPVMVPPPYRDERGRPIQHTSSELSRDVLLRALDDMATSLDQQGTTVRAVVVGGVVNTVYLRSRNSTHDIDFFLKNPNAPEHRAIHEAARYANRQAHGNLGAEWFNNATQMMMGSENQARVAGEAFKQNVVVYERMGDRGGLRLYAAPWAYAFCGKLNRLSSGTYRSYDMEDAIRYLHQHFEGSGQRRVSAQTVKGWCQMYRKEVTDEVLQRVGEAYESRYGYDPIEGQASSSQT